MLIGILSDSHGQYLMVRRALARFAELGVEHLIHCGDVGGTEVFDELVDQPVTFVWGNMDFPEAGLLTYLQTVGLNVPNGEPARLRLDDKTFAVFHGHERGFHRAVESLDVDYILHGHTHTVRDDRRGRTRIINPGALYRASRKTVATLDAVADKLTFHTIAGIAGCA